MIKTKLRSINQYIQCHLLDRHDWIADVEKNDLRLPTGDLSKERLMRHIFDAARLTCRRCGKVSKVAIDCEANYWHRRKKSHP